MQCSGPTRRDIIEYLPNAVFLKSLEGSILDVNHQACKVISYSREKLLRMEVDDLVLENAPSFFPEKFDKPPRSVKPLIKPRKYKVPSHL